MPISQATIRKGARLILGGSFNPIHHGHLITAQAAAETIGATQVVLMVAGMSPGKPAAALVNAEHRVQMCRLAIEHNPHFLVDDRETRRKGPSYTNETATELLSESATLFNWLIGADQLLSLSMWKDAERLLEAVPFTVMARPGWVFDWEALPPFIHALKGSVVAVPQVEISSSLIRGRVSAGRGIDYLTPPAVCEYIRAHRLYD